MQTCIFDDLVSGELSRQTRSAIHPIRPGRENGTLARRSEILPSQEPRFPCRAAETPPEFHHLPPGEGRGEGALQGIRLSADLLNVSRPYLMRLLEDRKIPFRLVGQHRRVRSDDLLAYQEKDDEERRRVADELTADAQELGMGY
jgi:excisionase family DNA binding protein